MNYIKLLNAVYEEFTEDSRLNPTHISLYMALFLDWNGSRFARDFFINRWEMMKVAKIGSKSTYHRCLRELNEWGYIKYIPSNNAYKGSSVRMTIFAATGKPVSDDYDLKLEQISAEYFPEKNGGQSHATPKIGPAGNKHRSSNGHGIDKQKTTDGQVLVSSINKYKQANSNKLPNDRQAVFNFFSKKGFPEKEARKFLEHYQQRNWKTNNGSKVRNWKAIANSWMENIFTNPEPKQAYSEDHLKTKKTKSYDQPL